jgi:pimeloyl-ACP methyl ester carboxylesterase
VRRTTLLFAAAALAWAAVHATAPAVRGWRPGAGARRRAGRLSVRTTGTSDGAVVVLLHGLPASGDAFGAAFDGVQRQLVVPDLLGFGRSRLPAGAPVDREAHLAALDEMATALGLDDRRLVVAGHSMGGLLAWQWAAGRVEQVDGVVTWCTPLLRDPDEARRALHAKAPGLGWIGVPGRLSRTLCTQLCTRRPGLAQWLYVLLYPKLPVVLARQLTQHTWSSYAPTMNEVVLAEPAWRAALRSLEQAGVPVLHAVGARDALAPPASLARLGEDAGALSVVAHPTGDHLLPLTESAWCADLLRRIDGGQA